MLWEIREKQCEKKGIVRKEKGWGEKWERKREKRKQFWGKVNCNKCKRGKKIKEKQGKKRSRGIQNSKKRKRLKK